MVLVLLVSKNTRQPSIEVHFSGNLQNRLLTKVAFTEFLETTSTLQGTLPL